MGILPLSFPYTYTQDLPQSRRIVLVQGKVKAEVGITKGKKLHSERKVQEDHTFA